MGNNYISIKDKGIIIYFTYLKKVAWNRSNEEMPTFKVHGIYKCNLKDKFIYHVNDGSSYNYFFWRQALFCDFKALWK